MTPPGVLSCGGISAWGSAKSAFGGEEMIGVARDIGADRRALEAPVGDQRIEPDRVHDGAGKDVATDFGGFFDHGDGDFGDGAA